MDGITKEEMEEIDRKFKEIEDLQVEVDRILNHKNPLVRFFLFRKAVRLHKEAGRKFVEFFHPILSLDKIR